LNLVVGFLDAQEKAKKWKRERCDVEGRKGTKRKSRCKQRKLPPLAA